jgi:hypothetical protein
MQRRFAEKLVLKAPIPGIVAALPTVHALQFLAGNKESTETRGSKILVYQPVR